MSTFREMGLCGHSKPLEYEVMPETNCWQCTSHASDTHGYPQLVRGGVKILAHRYVLSLTENIARYSVLHSCDNRRCINPGHLRIGTPKDNGSDMIERGRSLKGTRNPDNKLTESQVLEIRASTEPYKVLCARYGVYKGHISNIKARRCWKWL